MKNLNRNKIVSIVATIILISGAIWWRVNASSAEDNNKVDTGQKASAVKPALTITTTTPLLSEWPVELSATGNIEAWQEALVGAEVNGLRLTEVKVNVGDTVQRGQILAVFSDIAIKADVAQVRAAVAEAEAALAEAKANADRTRQITTPGVMSAQQVSQYLTAEQTAKARLESARAQLANQQIRLDQTQLIAPDDGLISSRTATVGAVVSAGQELFRLIRQNRLEWRAEVTAVELPQIRIGQAVTLSAPGGLRAKGSVRMVAPTVNQQTRMALIYVDIAADTGMKAGMFARGDFEIGKSKVTALPQSAIVQREGFSYVYRVGADNKISQLKVEVGRRLDGQVEISRGLEPQAKLAATGTAFLADGDTVRVVDTPLNQARSEQ
jgi:HlyD family secretion protein